jgi:protein-S-isoprenylcysteine O-methyltransferase Ste14
VTRSASTPRIRALQLYYCLLLAAVAVCEPICWHGVAARAMELAGLAIVAVAVLGRIWTTLHIAGRKDQRVVAAGPYGRCRHPLYTLSILASLGIGLATRSTVLTLATVGVSLVLHFAAMVREERNLEAALGTPYRDYAARVPRFWPRLGRLELPATLTVSRSIYWKAILDAGSILALYVALELIAAGRDAGVWRTLFSVY